MEPNTAFLNQFQTYYGKRFEIITGRNAYVFEKNQHARMLAEDGIYLLLENQPQDNLKHRYNKALFIPARVADKFFPTNDPEKVKASFYLGADKMRFEFHLQQHKLYNMEPCLIKTVKFEDTRRAFRIDRTDYEFLLKNKGSFIFIFTVGYSPDIFIQSTVLKAESIVGFLDNDKKSITLNFELNAYALKMLDDLNWRKYLTKEKMPPKPIFPVEQANPEHRNPELRTIPSKTLNWVVDNYLTVGTPIKITFPEGKHDLILECTITKQERKIHEETPNLA
jgi:hypothetical protein